MLFTASHSADDDLYDAEEAAAVDAHDVSDPGMEAAAMERAVMIAEDFKEEQIKKNSKKLSKETLLGKIKSFFRNDFDDDDEDDLLEAEDAAAFDAHDLSDPGMEAAAMERAVMIAEEFRESHKHPHENKSDNEADANKAKHGSDTHIKTVEEHYKSMKKEISEIERLISKAAEVDQSEVRDNSG